MQSIYGKVARLLRGASERVTGFVLDGGEEIRFSADQIETVSDIIPLGSRVEISGELDRSDDNRVILNAVYMTNLESNRTTILPGPVRLGKPGMLSDATPTPTASLALPHKKEDATSCEGGSQPQSSQNVIDLDTRKDATGGGQSWHESREHAHRHPLLQPRAQRSDAAAEIERAYDRLHSIQAILAYLNIMKRQVHGISQMHEEAKHTYEQAISRHAARDFEGARELATASTCLSRVVENVISKSLRSDSSYPSLVPRPPEHLGTPGESSQVEDELNEVAAVLSRIHWIMENGTLPLEDRTQVRRIFAWSEAFYQQSKRTYQHGCEEDAMDLARAAKAAAHSAEHVCRNWYVAQAGNSQNHMIPSDYPALA